MTVSASQRLPKDPIDRSAALLTRSLPGLRDQLPACLPPEAAEVIMLARNQRAEMYGSMEDLTDRCRSLGEEMDRTGVVMHLVDEADSDSIVNHMDETTRTLSEASVASAAGAVTAEEVVDNVRRIPVAVRR